MNVRVAISTEDTGPGCMVPPRPRPGARYRPGLCWCETGLVLGLWLHDIDGSIDRTAVDCADIGLG